ncbi:MAG: AAA family ATPase [Acidimicrobiales bacterium]
MSDPSTDPAAAAHRLEEALFEVRRVIVGQEHMVERLFVALLARGHILLEGLPGVAKTLAVSTLSEVIGGSFVRLQFTPDLLPSDLMGTRIWRQSKEGFDIEWGPVFANFVLTDEINRAPAKVQSALLEIMAERQVSIGGETKALPAPFLVLATQNPIESEGVYTLPEAQRDRFLMKVTVDYPTPADELEIVRRMGVSPPEARQVLSIEQLLALQEAADRVYVDAGVAQYAVDLVMATREPSHRGLAELEPLIEFGVSPRATLGLVAAARGIAVLRGRNYATPQDVFDVARDVLRHRLMLTYEALAKNLSVDDVLNRLLSVVPAAAISPRDAVTPAATPAPPAASPGVAAPAPPPPTETFPTPGAPVAGDTPTPPVTQTPTPVTAPAPPADAGQALPPPPPPDLLGGNRS